MLLVRDDDTVTIFLDVHGSIWGLRLTKIKFGQIFNDHDSVIDFAMETE